MILTSIKNRFAESSDFIRFALRVNLFVWVFIAGAVAGVYLLQWQIDKEVAAGSFICEGIK